MPKRKGAIAAAGRETTCRLYQVEAIVEKSGSKYQVRWEGFGPADDTLEPRENLENAEEMVTAYEATHKQQRVICKGCGGTYKNPNTLASHKSRNCPQRRVTPKAVASPKAAHKRAQVPAADLPAALEQLRAKPTENTKAEEKAEHTITPNAVEEHERTTKVARRDEKIEQGLVDNKELSKLWKWFRDVDMQQVSHIGADETGDCWQKLSNMTYCGLQASPELQNLLAALHFQYGVDGFSGRAQRVRTR